MFDFGLNNSQLGAGCNVLPARRISATTPDICCRASLEQHGCQEGNLVMSRVACVTPSWIFSRPLQQVDSLQLSTIRRECKHNTR